MPVPMKVKPDDHHAMPFQFPHNGPLGTIQHLNQCEGLTKLELGALLIAGQMCFSYDNIDDCANKAVQLAGAVIDLCRQEESEEPNSPNPRRS
jgi:hypothetical protein